MDELARSWLTRGRVRIGRVSRAPLARSTVGVSVSRVVAGLLLLLASVVVAREKGAAALGIFGLASTVAVYAATIGDAGTSVYLLARLAQVPRRGWSLVWADAVRFQLRSAAVLSAVYLVGVVGLTQGTERLALLAALPWWLGLRLSLATRSVFIAAERVGAEARGTVVESVVGLAAVTAAILLTGSPAVAVLGIGAGAIVGTGVRLRGLAGLGVHREAAIGSAREFAQRALPYAAGATLHVLYLRVDVLLLAAFAGPRQLGLYQPAVRFSAAAIIVPDAIASVMLGRTSRSPDDVEAKRRQEQLLAIGVVVCSCILAVVAVAGKWLLGAVFGPEFRQGWVALMLLTVASALAFVAALNGTALTARGLQAERVKCLALAAVVAVGAGAPVVALWGYNGAAAVSVANEVVLVSAFGFALLTKVGRHAVLLPRLPGCMRRPREG